MIRVLVLCAAALFVGCSTNEIFLTTGPTDSTSGDGTISVPPQAVQRVVVSGPPRFQNGAEETYLVTMFGAGDVRVLAPYRAFVEGDALLEILTPAGTGSNNDEVIVKGRGVGDTVLAITSGSVTGRIAIKVAEATP